MVVTGQPGAGKSAVVARAALALEARGIGPGMAFHTRGATHSDMLRGVADLVSYDGVPERDALLDALLAGYFQQGADLGDEETLLAIGSCHGIDPVAWKAWLAHGHRLPEPNRVSSVPLLVFNRQVSLPGAQPVDVLLEAMGEACEAPRIALI